MKILATDDPYDILGVSIEASDAVIISSYKAMVLKYHPDKHAKNPEDAALATEVTRKLNAAKIQALSEGKKDKTRQDWHDIQLTDHEPFFNHMRSLMINGIFSKSKDSFDLFDSSYHYCLGMVLHWVQVVLDNRPQAYYQNVKVAFENTVSTTDFTNFAKQTKPYLLKNIKKTISANGLGKVLSENMQSQDSMTVCKKNIRWNLDPNALSNLIDESIINSPNTPFLFHNAYEKAPKFVGILYSNNSFYLFSPYCLLLNRSGNDLIPLHKEELLGYLIRHFYGKQNALSNEANLASAPIGLCSFEREAIPYLEDKADVNQIVIQATSDSITAQHEDFLSFVGTYYLPRSIRAARSVLESVRDGHIQVVLANMYNQAKRYFTPALLHEFLDEAIATEHLTLAIEICSIDRDDNELTQELCAYYINHYFTHAASYHKLAVIVAEFKKIHLDLKSLINRELLHPESNLSPNLISLLEDRDNLHCFFDLGFILNEEKREGIVRHVSVKLNGLAREYDDAKWLREARDIREGDLPPQPVTLGHSPSAMLQKQIDVFGMLTANNYTLCIKDGHSIDENPFMALFKAGQIEWLRQLCQSGHINFNVKDKKGKTVLNHISALKQWDMIAFLYLEAKAEFSVGEKISYEEIPQLRAWFEQVDSLAPIYPNQVQDIEWLLSLVIKETDVLALAFSKNRMDIVRFLLENGFMDRLKANPSLYLYHASKFEATIFILQQLSLPELTDNRRLSQYIGYDYKDAIRLEKLPMQDHSDNFIDLHGLSEEELDAVLVRLPFSQLTKIAIEGQKSVYYSESDELTDCLPFFFYPDLIKKEIKSIKRAVLNPEDNHLPDIVFYLNRLLSLFASLEGLENWASKKRKYIRKMSLSDEEINLKAEVYSNSFECFQKERKPIALKVSFDDKNRVCDFRFIPSLAAGLGYSRLLFTEFSPVSKLQRKISTIDIESFFLLRKFYPLKLLFEELLSLPHSELDLPQDSSESIRLFLDFKTRYDKEFPAKQREIAALVQDDTYHYTQCV